MGSVVLARHLQSGDLVAAKRIQPKFLGDAEIVKRFARESRILEGLDHENVVRIRDTYIDDTGGVIVMQYVEGGTLTQAINNKRPAEELLQWFIGVATGLAFLHSHGVVHRDLKPDNVLLDGPVARISDFGLARLLARDSTTLTMRGAFLGTRLYAAPEQHDNAVNVTTGCDLYSLGLIAYEIATGRSPYRMPINTNRLAPNLHDVLIKALGEDPAERPTGEALAAALRVQLGL
jgi:serine/threonine protein kinase